jgi:hypothetical protein
MRDQKGLIERKGKKMFDKIKQDKNGFKRNDGEKRSFGEKAKAKMVQRSAPTRSKMIVRNGSGSRGGGARGGFRGAARGGSSRGGSSRGGSSRGGSSRGGSSRGGSSRGGRR